MIKTGSRIGEEILEGARGTGSSIGIGGLGSVVGCGPKTESKEGECNVVGGGPKMESEVLVRGPKIEAEGVVCGPKMEG